MYDENNFQYEDDTIHYGSSHHEEHTERTRGTVMVEIIKILKSLINIFDIVSEHINTEK